MDDLCTGKALNGLYSRVVVYPPSGSTAVGDLMIAVACAPPMHPDQPWSVSAASQMTSEGQWVHLGVFTGPAEKTPLKPAQGQLANNPIWASVVVPGATVVLGAWGQPCCQKPGDGLCGGDWHDNVRSTCYEEGCDYLWCPEGYVQEAGTAVWFFTAHDEARPLEVEGKLLELSNSQQTMAVASAQVGPGLVLGRMATPAPGSNWDHGIAVCVVVA